MKTLIVLMLLMTNKAFGVTGDECFMAMKTFDKHSTTMSIKVSTGENQIGIVYIVPDKAKTSMQDRSAFAQLRRVCALAGVKRAYHSRPEAPSQPVTSCYGMNCDKFEGSLKKIVSVTEFLAQAGLK